MIGHTGPVDVRRLELLLELSRLGSMREVADELGLTTSTVSQQLATLATEVGVNDSRSDPFRLMRLDAATGAQTALFLLPEGAQLVAAGSATSQNAWPRVARLRDLPTPHTAATAHLELYARLGLSTGDIMGTPWVPVPD